MDFQRASGDLTTLILSYLEGLIDDNTGIRREELLPRCRRLKLTIRHRHFSSDRAPPKIQRSDHFLGFIFHGPGQILRFTYIVAQIVEFSRAVLEPLDQLEIAFPQGAAGDSTLRT